MIRLPGDFGETSLVAAISLPGGCVATSLPEAARPAGGPDPRRPRFAPGGLGETSLPEAALPRTLLVRDDVEVDWVRAWR